MSFEYTAPAIIKWRLDDFMKIIDIFEEDFADKVHHKVSVGQNYETILLHIVGKSMVTTKEILTLCAHGYPDGALSLGRNLYEQMIITSFFEIHKKDNDFQKYVDDFFLSYDTQRNKCLRDIDKYVPENDIENETDNLYRSTTRNKGRDYWWTGCDSFSKLIEHVIYHQTDEAFKKFLGIQYMRYKRACIALHAGCIGNSIRIGRNYGFHVVDTSPTLVGQSTPLVYAAISLIAIIGVTCTAFQMDKSKYLNRLNELAIFYQNCEEHEISNSK